MSSSRQIVNAEVASIQYTSSKFKALPGGNGRRQYQKVGVDRGVRRADSAVE